MVARDQAAPGLTTPSFIDLFSEAAQGYAAARPGYPEPLFEFIAGLAPRNSRAWDCGTGNGQAAVSLARHFDEVCATDPSEEQIRNAVPARNVAYSVQAAEHTSFPSAAFDAICVAQALHWFRLDEFFAEARRVAAPGAVLAAWGYSWFSVSPRFDAAFDQRILHSIEPYWAPNNRLLWNGYADVRFPFERLAAPPFAIAVDWTLHELLAFTGTWSALRRCVAAEGPGFLRDAQADLVAGWGDEQAPRRVTLPLHLVVGRLA